MEPARDRVWNGQTPEQRSGERRARLIGAGVELMGTSGAGAVTVRAICRTTHISERHFYELFASKDEYVVAVYDQVLEEGAALIADLAPAPGVARGSEATLRHLLGAWVDYLEHDPRRGRIVVIEGATHPLLAARGRQMALALMRSYLAFATGDNTVPSDPSADEVTAVLVFAGIWGVLLSWQGGALDSELGRDELVEHLVTIIQKLHLPGA